MKQERLFDLEQQKKFLTYLNKNLKDKVGVLETQKDVLSEVLERGVSRKASRTPTPRLKLFYALTVSSVLLTGAVAASSYLLDSPEAEAPLKTRYLVENLRGDTVDTWKLWKIDSQGTLVVSIANAALADENKINAIKDAILSDETITIDDSLTHKGPPGSVSTYFMGWKGALDKASATETKYSVPTKFRIIESDDGVGDIIITLSTSKDQDGYSGFTKSTVEGNQILKSQITIYDVDSLSDEMLSAITRHEFGHAIGLGHSTAPEDLMAPDISMQIPYISECDVSAISHLYD
ncbi:MAG: matrixin family metalloprotease, partial [Nitrososphaera sp.]|nr:matrixin family metalloprotease [Nitrososphaera sp.]